MLQFLFPYMPRNLKQDPASSQIFGTVIPPSINKKLNIINQAVKY